jgi:hypothetical protein
LENSGNPIVSFELFFGCTWIGCSMTTGGRVDVDGTFFTCTTGFFTCESTNVTHFPINSTTKLTLTSGRIFRITPSSRSGLLLSPSMNPGPVIGSRTFGSGRLASTGTK